MPMYPTLARYRGDYTPAPAPAPAPDKYREISPYATPIPSYARLTRGASLQDVAPSPRPSRWYLVLNCAHLLEYFNPTLILPLPRWFKCIVNKNSSVKCHCIQCDQCWN